MLPDPSLPRCPRCGEPDVRSSHRQMPLFSFLGLRYYRCLGCFKRFLGRRAGSSRRKARAPDEHTHP